MLMRRGPNHARRGTPLSDRQGTTIAAAKSGVAALEFALIAPLLATLTIGVFDVARALIIWQQLNNAAEAIAQAAEKMSITVSNNNTATELTPQQMQDAMTSIYAEIPGLSASPGVSLGDGKGSFRGAFSVTLSDVVFYPICKTADVSKCGGAQTPYTVWSSYLTVGGSQLLQYPKNAPYSQLVRPCYPTKLVAVNQFPNNSNELQDMVNPIIVSKGVSMTLTPQIVADVSYVFTPNFPLFGFVKTVTLWASATLPSPYGGLDQQVILNAPAGVYNASPPSNPEACPIPPGN